MLNTKRITGSKTLKTRSISLSIEIQVPGDEERTKAYLTLIRNEITAELPNIRKIPIRMSRD